MRVAMYLANLSGGGAERVMVSLLAALVRQGVEVEVVVAVAQGPYVDTVRALAPLTDLQAGSAMRSVVPLVRWLRQRRPAVLVSALDHANVACVAAVSLARCGTVAVVTHHNSLHRLPFSDLGRKDKAVRLALRWAYPRAAAVVAVSQGVARELGDLLPQARSRIACIYNPVVRADLAELASAPLDHPWFASAQPPVVMAAGRLSAEKDYALLIDAFALVLQRRPARLVLLGEGPLRGALQAQIDRLGLASYVEMPGFESNPYKYLRRAAVFVLSSRYEGLPTVLIEALALGTAVVATDCETGPREILQGGALGLLVPVGDAPAMAAAIAQVLDDRPPPVDPRALLPFAEDEAASRYSALFERVAAAAQRTIT